MFIKLLQWVQGVIAKMIGQNTLKSATGATVAISSLMAEKLERWRSMYVNASPWLSDDVKSLNLAAAISSEIARSVTIEAEVEISGGPRADYLSGQMTSLLSRIRPRVEYSQAVGGMVMKPYVVGAGIGIDFVYADQFYPISFDENGRITDCVFADVKTVGTSYYTRLERHKMIAEGVEITNKAFRSSSKNDLGQPVPLNSIPEWAEILAWSIIQNVDRLLVGYYKTPYANNVDTASPLGVSAYARAEDLIQQADEQWTALLWEFESGKRALYVDELAFEKRDGKPVLPNKRLYRTLKGGTSEADFFNEWTPTLREASILAGLEAILRKIEFNCGLAYGTLSDPQAVDRTATEIVAARQRSAATVTDNQKALEAALNDLLYAMDALASAYGLAPAGTYEAAYHWDDSIVTDYATQFSHDAQAIGLGVMSKVRFLMRNYGMTEEMARAELAAINEQQAPLDLFAA